MSIEAANIICNQMRLALIYKESIKIIPLKMRKKLVEYAKGLTLRIPSQVPTPISSIPSFECLKVIREFQYLACDSLWGIRDNVMYQRNEMNEGNESCNGNESLPTTAGIVNN